MIRLGIVAGSLPAIGNHDNGSNDDNSNNNDEIKHSNNRKKNEVCEFQSALEPQGPCELHHAWTKSNCTSNQDMTAYEFKPSWKNKTHGNHAKQDG